MVGGNLQRADRMETQRCGSRDPHGSHAWWPAGSSERMWCWGTVPPSTVPAPAEEVREDEKWPRMREAEECAKIAQQEGDRLFRIGDPVTSAAEACWRIAALIRQRIDGPLAPF